MQAVHRAGHGLVPNEIIAVSEDDVFRFLGRVNDPVDHSQVDEGLPDDPLHRPDGLDVAASGGRRDAYMALLDEHDLIIRRSLVAWRGREVKHTGDGIMASFDDVGDALGVRSRSRPASRPGCPTGRARASVRIGIAAGEPVDHNDDLFGSTVNLASRICDARTLAISSHQTSFTRWGPREASPSGRVMTSS